MENGWIFAFNSSNIKVVIPEKLTWNEEDWKCNVCQSPKKDEKCTVYPVLVLIIK